MKHQDEDTARNVQVDFPDLREGLAVETGDQNHIGTVAEVFRDLGQIESFGTTGVLPEQEGFEPENYAYSTAMPGAGDNYLVVRQPDGEILYVPFSSVDGVENGKVVLAVDHANLTDMNWQVRPDALKSLPEYDVDTGGEPHVA